MKGSSEILAKMLRLKAQGNPQAEFITMSYLCAIAQKDPGTDKIRRTLGIKTKEDKRNLLEAGRVWGMMHLGEPSCVKAARSAYNSLSPVEQMALQVQEERRFVLGKRTIPISRLTSAKM